MFFNIVVVFAEFEAGLIGMRTREGAAIAKTGSKLRGKRPKLLEMQRMELRRILDQRSCRTLLCIASNRLSNAGQAESTLERHSALSRSRPQDAPY
ncbi:MAG: hypothetical protein OXC26_08040 [Albidovulum sp.]|nr:hypothetical protein [Albidovulum sp.]